MSRRSPRKSASAVIPPNPGKTPRRCCRCDGRPLLSNCAHSSTNRLRDHESHPAKTTAVAGHQDVLEVGQAGLATQGDSEDYHIDPRLRGRAATLDDLSDSRLSARPLDPPTPSSATISGNGEGVVPRSVSVSLDGEENESSGSEKKDYGIVEGAMRGNQRYEIPRSRALRGSCITSSDASKRFQRIIRELVIRSENLAEETGCWLYLAAQHGTAVTPFVHYASPRLRSEAIPELDIIHANFSQMMKTLVSSRRRDVMELAMELEEKNEQLETANAAILAARQETMERNDALVQRDAIIAELSRRLDHRAGSD